MKYKVLYILGSEKNYRRRVYIVTKSEYEILAQLDTFVLRESIHGEKIYRSCETDRHYMIKEEI